MVCFGGGGGGGGSGGGICGGVRREDRRCHTAEGLEGSLPVVSVLLSSLAGVAAVPGDQAVVVRRRRWRERWRHRRRGNRPHHGILCTASETGN